MTRRRYPGPRHPVPQPLAALRGRRRGPPRGARTRARRCDAGRRGARAQIDLTVVSVLLDAGAGPAWGYVEAPSGPRYTRSEGLGVASFRAFMAGAFSATPGDPLRVDAAALAALDDASAGARCSRRTRPIRSSGSTAARRCCGGSAHALTSERDVFGATARPGGAVRPRCRRTARRRRSRAPTILRALLDALGVDLADRQHARRTSRSATAGGIRARAATGRPRAGCRSTSCRSGSPTRCSSRSNGRASTRDRPRRADRRCPSTATAACCSTPACSRCATDADAAAAHDVGERARRRVARADGGAARRARAAACATRAAARRTCRSPASSRAARGPPGASSRASCAAATPPLHDRQRRHRVLNFHASQRLESACPRMCTCSTTRSSSTSSRCCARRKPARRASGAC